VASPSIDRIRDDLVAWYRRGHRDLPWRNTRDPYAIWVSEIMLQQTRVETVAPRFSRWLARFPTVSALAGAPLDDVLAEWAGLGYYARARNLHAAAREVEERYGGRVPDGAEGVRALPGIGRYTAGAILSIAYGKPAPILDGNVVRVLSRIFRIGGDPRGPAAQKKLWDLAGLLVSKGDPSDLNQGLMELGATVCTPRRPACLTCPLTTSCGARRAGDAEAFPEATRATKVIEITQVSVALLSRGEVLLARRPPRGLWGGLFELPSGEPAAGEALPAAALRVARERVGVAARAPSPLADFTHVLSHRKIAFHGFRAAAARRAVRLDGYDDHRWVTPKEAGSLGISRATARLLAELR
jgi:A/G-specific adenine glycosylase